MCKILTDNLRTHDTETYTSYFIIYDAMILSLFNKQRTCNLLQA